MTILYNINYYNLFQTKISLLAKYKIKWCYIQLNIYYFNINNDASSYCYFKYYLN